MKILSSDYLLLLNVIVVQLEAPAQLLFSYAKITADFHKKKNTIYYTHKKDEYFSKPIHLHVNCVGSN